MKVVAVALAVFIVFTCVSIACNNEVNNTNNAPMRFTDVLKTFGDLSDRFEHQLKSFYGTFDYWANLFSGNITPELLVEELKSLENVGELKDFFFKYNPAVNFVRSGYQLAIFVGFTVYEGLVLVFDLFRLCWGFIFGVPRPSK